jgi:hypothetical protein
MLNAMPILLTKHYYNVSSNYKFKTARYVLYTSTEASLNVCTIKFTLILNAGFQFRSGGVPNEIISQRVCNFDSYNVESAVEVLMKLYPNQI